MGENCKMTNLEQIKHDKTIEAEEFYKLLGIGDGTNKLSINTEDEEYPQDIRQIERLHSKKKLYWTRLSINSTPCSIVE